MGKIEIVKSIDAVFLGEIRASAKEKGISISKPVELYVVELLVRYAAIDTLLEQFPGEQKGLIPIAFDVLKEKKTAADLKRIGDRCLFLVSFFSEGIERRVKEGGREYYCVMGSTTYFHLGTHYYKRRNLPVSQIYFELGQKFHGLVKIISSINLVEEND